MAGVFIAILLALRSLDIVFTPILVTVISVSYLVTNLFIEALRGGHLLPQKVLEYGMIALIASYILLFV